MMWSDWDKSAMALCIWREAQGEPIEGQKAIASVILNRLNAQTKSVHHVIFASDILEQKWQFSSMTAVGDPTLITWPHKPNPAFDQIMQIVEMAYNGALVDGTSGATHYFNPAVVLPSWAGKMTKTITIGHHDFYKD